MLLRASRQVFAFSFLQPGTRVLASTQEAIFLICSSKLDRISLLIQHAERKSFVQQFLGQPFIHP